MSVQRILFGVAGLSLVPILFLTDRLHADFTSTTAPPATAPATVAPVGRVSGESVTSPGIPGTPPEPSPLAPPAPIDVEGTPPSGASARGLIESAAELAITNAALGTPTSPAAMPATPPPDVIDDRGPIAGSVFDREDHFERHPVDSARSITGSTFDREDRVDEHPVP